MNRLLLLASLLASAFLAGPNFSAAAEATGKGGEDKKAIAAAAKATRVAQAREAVNSGNVLQKVLDPYSSNIELFREFTDQGGLNSESDFYGIKVVEASIEWKPDGSFKTALLTVTRRSSPRDVREALSTACRVSPNAWKTENTDVMRGEARNGAVKCTYFTRSDVRTYDIVIHSGDSGKK